MKKIFVENIENGMLLARDVCGSSGNALLGKGIELTVTMGRRLKNWGVSFVYVEGEEEHKEEEPSVEVSPEEVRKQLEGKFADVLNNPIMQELFTAVYNFKCHKNSS